MNAFVIHAMEDHPGPEKADSRDQALDHSALGVGNMTARRALELTRDDDDQCGSEGNESVRSQASGFAMGIAIQPDQAADQRCERES